MKPFESVCTLHPGDVVFGQHGDCLDTLLGSCIAIVLTDPRRTVGVMCHIVHTGQASRSASATGSYGDVALDGRARRAEGRGRARVRARHDVHRSHPF